MKPRAKQLEGAGVGSCFPEGLRAQIGSLWLCMGPSSFHIRIDRRSSTGSKQILIGLLVGTWTFSIVADLLVLGPVLAFLGLWD